MRIFGVLGKCGFYFEHQGMKKCSSSNRRIWVGTVSFSQHLYHFYLFYIHVHIFLSSLVFNGFSWILLNWLFCFNMYQALMNKISSIATVLLAIGYVLKLIKNAGKGTQNGLHNILFLFSDNNWLIYENIGRK